MVQLKRECIEFEWHNEIRFAGFRGEISADAAGNLIVEAPGRGSAAGGGRIIKFSEPVK